MMKTPDNMTPQEKKDIKQIILTEGTTSTAFEKTLQYYKYNSMNPFQRYTLFLIFSFAHSLKTDPKALDTYFNLPSVECQSAFQNMYMALNWVDKDNSSEIMRLFDTLKNIQKLDDPQMMPQMIDAMVSKDDVPFAYSFALAQCLVSDEKITEYTDAKQKTLEFLAALGTETYESLTDKGGLEDMYKQTTEKIRLTKETMELKKQMAFGMSFSPQDKLMLLLSAGVVTSAAGYVISREYNPQRARRQSI